MRSIAKKYWWESIRSTRLPSPCRLPEGADLPTSILGEFHHILFPPLLQAGHVFFTQDGGEGLVAGRVVVGRLAEAAVELAELSLLLEVVVVGRRVVAVGSCRLVAENLLGVRLVAFFVLKEPNVDAV